MVYLVKDGLMIETGTGYYLIIEWRRRIKLVLPNCLNLFSIERHLIYSVLNNNLDTVFEIIYLFNNLSLYYIFALLGCSPRKVVILGLSIEMFIFHFCLFNMFYLPHS